MLRSPLVYSDLEQKCSLQSPEPIVQTTIYDRSVRHTMASEGLTCGISRHRLIVQDCANNATSASAILIVNIDWLQNRLKKDSQNPNPHKATQGNLVADFHLYIPKYKHRIRRKCIVGHDRNDCN